MQCHDVDVPVIRYNFVNLSGLPDLQKEAVCGMFLSFSRIVSRLTCGWQTLLPS